jgi:hypothetical protein
MPGLSMPGMGAEAGGGLAIADPAMSMPSSGNLAQLISTMTNPQQEMGVR